MANKKSEGTDGVFVKKSGITELLGKIKALEQEVETKTKEMREFMVMKEIEQEVYIKKIKKLENELDISKKAYERVEANKEKKHRSEMQKLETQLTVKNTFAETLSTDLSDLKKKLKAKETENQQLQANISKLSSQKNNDQNAQNELTKVKQNLVKLQSKHQKVTSELSKYNSVPFFKEVIATKELLSKFEDKISKTKITPENIEELEQKRQIYKIEIEKRKTRNKKLLENLNNKGVLSGDYHDEAIEKLESQVQKFNKQNAEDFQTKLKKVYEIAHLTAELSGKLNKDIPEIVNEVVQSVKARENELNGLRNSSFQQNFNNQEKKYKELIKKLDDEKLLFESLLRNVPGPSKNQPKILTATGRAEDLLKTSGAATSSKSDGMEKSLTDLKKECEALFDKYYTGESPQDLDKPKNFDDKAKRDTPTGWNFDSLDNKGGDD